MSDNDVDDPASTGNEVETESLNANTSVNQNPEPQANAQAEPGAGAEQEAKSPQDSRPALNADEAFCESCGEVIKREAEICPKCGVRQRSNMTPEAPQPANEQNPGLAALASVIIPGAGQVYNGQLMKGIGLMIAYGISILLIFVLVGFITTPAIWIFGVYDAYRTAEKINTGEVVIS